VGSNSTFYFATVPEYKLCKATVVMYNDEGDAEQSEYTGAEEID
jgi:hypothetical protein